MLVIEAKNDCRISAKTKKELYLYVSYINIIFKETNEEYILLLKFT